MSWKNDENIFHQKCRKQYCLVTERVSGDACHGISSKKPWFLHAFPCFLCTVGFPIVNACSTASLYSNPCLLWGWGAGSKHLYLHEFLTENYVRWRDHYLRSNSFSTSLATASRSPTYDNPSYERTHHMKSWTVWHPVSSLFI